MATQNSFLPSLDISLIATFLMSFGYLLRHSSILDRIYSSNLSIILIIILWIISAHSSILSFASRTYTSPFLMCVAMLAGSFAIMMVARSIASYSKALKRFFLFAGRNSMAIYCVQTFDWTIPWSNLPLFEGLPAFHLLECILRIGYTLLFIILMRSVL